MQPTTSFYDLRVWQEAMSLVEEIYLLSKRFPADQAEVETQILIAKRLGYCSSDAHAAAMKQVEDVGRMLNGLITSLQPEDVEP